MDVLQEYVRREAGTLFVVTHDGAIAQRCEHHFVLEEKVLKAS
jgi:predicted ABC-type transport system involved in lysophospholipase L1 biosynthesis ATPase subunit